MLVPFTLIFLTCQKNTYVWVVFWASKTRRWFYSIISRELKKILNTRLFVYPHRVEISLLSVAGQDSRRIYSWTHLYFFICFIKHGPNFKTGRVNSTLFQFISLRDNKHTSKTRVKENTRHIYFQVLNINQGCVQNRSG